MMCCDSLACSFMFWSVGSFFFLATLLVLAMIAHEAWTYYEYSKRLRELNEKYGN